MVNIPVERCVGGRELTEVRLSFDATSVVYVESAGGAAALILQALDGAPARQLSAHPRPRPGRGLGGGCWCWTSGGDAVVYVAVDGDLWLQPVPGGSVRRLTSHGANRTASAPAAMSDGERIAYVLDEAEVWTVAVGDGTSQRVDDGSADFCLDPSPSFTGTELTWQAWNVPDMPWDGSRLQRAQLADDGTVIGCSEIRVDGALQQPGSLADGRALCVSDAGGWANVWLDDAPLVDEPFEHAGPTWGPGQRSYAASPDGARVAFTRNEAGFGRLCVVDAATREVREVARGVHGSLSWRGDRLAALRTGARTPTQAVVYDTATWQRTVLAVGALSGWEREPLVEPEAVEIEGPDGATVFARLVRADVPTGGLLLWLHGGPTDQWQVTFMPRLAYWRSRGWNVLMPDHRGSTGHGRAYQQALRGRWGELDVGDSIAALRTAHASGWGRPERTIIIGGSAGGFTTLGVVAAVPELVAGAVALYPVSDLIALGERSHRFERHYTDTLVGPRPMADAPLRERSPLTFAAQLRHTPLLILHGGDDPVVPVEQSIELAAAIEAAGGSVELHVYPGEGHGMRMIDNQLDEYARLGAFMSRCAPDG